MIPLLGREAVRAFDRDAIERLGVAGALLMENAGRGATDVLVARLGDALARPVVVGGPGQNGGDAWVVARHLRARGLTPRVFLLGAPARVRGDAAPNLAALGPLGVDVEVVEDAGGLRALEAALADATVIVDGVFGVGLDRAVEGIHADALRAMDRAPAPVLALDVPSGVDAETGAVLGVAPRAAVTATFGAHKPGLHQHPGAALAGEVVLVDLGVPPPVDAPDTLFEPEDAAAHLAPRAADAHKGTAGHVLVLAGSPGRTGAAALAGLGAMRAGAGLVTLAARGAAREALDRKVLELMTAAVDDADVEQAARDVAAHLEGKRALVVGPGLGTDPLGLALARRVAAEAAVPAVLDADALTAHEADLGALRAAAAPRVLTPHPGEAARLLGGDGAAVQRDRLGAAAALAARAGAVVVLKGARTVVAHPGGRRRVCRRGTPALGVAGTGDVLAGIVGALLAAGLDAFDAASVGVVAHALAGEAAAQGDRGLLAHEVADALPGVLVRLVAARGRGFTNPAAPLPR